MFSYCKYILHSLTCWEKLKENVLLNKTLSFYFSYITYNIQSLEFCKKYSTSVPTFLHNRPRMLVEHCIKRIPPEVQNIPVENIQEIGERAFDVHSVDSNNVYKVMITNTEPTCTCEDYARHHLPCKHMLAVIMSVPHCSWDTLPNGYKTCPHFSLDQNIIQQCIQSIPDCQSNPATVQSENPDRDIQLTSKEESPLKSSQTPIEETKALDPIHVILQSALGGLNDIKSNMYLINDTLDLQEIYEKILELKSLSASKIKTDAGLPLNTSDHHRPPLTLKRKAGSLPLRKKYRKKNVKHSVHFAENDDVMIIDGTYDMPCRQEMSIDSVNTTMEQSMANDTITEQMAECQSKDRPATVEILWTIKPFDYLVSKIGSFKVTDTSISYLKSSLSDEVYMYLLYFSVSFIYIY